MSYQIHTYSELGNRFTTICGSNIPNGSSRMANPPSVIRTRHAFRNYSKISPERDPTNQSPLFIASSNRHQTKSTPQLLVKTKPATQLVKNL